MKWTVAIISMSLVWAAGCRKDAPDQPPVVPMPAPSAPGNIPVAEEGGGDPAGQSADGKAAVAETRDRVPFGSLPAAPSEPLELLATKAGNRCRAKDANCSLLPPLAARIETDVKTARALLGAGTDQQKSVLLQALLQTRSETTDAVLVEQLIAQNGQLNTSVVDALATRRSTVAVQTLVGLLKKTIGGDVIHIVDALSRIGTPEAAKALQAGLKAKRLRPHWGTICRAVSRTLDVGAIPEVAKLGAALNASERQAEGCRGAEVALRMYQSGTRLALNVGAEQKRKPQVAIHQNVDEPNALRIRIVTDTDKPCESVEDVLQLRLPLDRTGAPVTGHGVVPQPFIGKELGSRDVVYLFRLDGLTLKRGAPLSGNMHLDVRTKDQPRVIASGSFSGVYCGVQ